jgi:glycosyltransferase involved in cell wall biosynthesis
MKFSVLIPLYNKALYIEGTIRSVLAQAFQDFEVIVIDDGSTDGGAEIVRSIADPRIRLVTQANAGVSAARNLGIQMARGEWIAFLDADDWHHPRYLEALLQAQAKFPEADTVCARHIDVPNSSGLWSTAWPPLPQEPEVELIPDLALRWMAGPTFCTSSTSARASRLKSMQPCFVVGESSGEDLDLFFRLAEQAPVALSLSPMVAYRVDVQGSLSAAHPYVNMAPYLQRMRARALSGVMSKTKSRSALWLVAQHEVSMSRQALAMGERLEGLRWLYKGRRAATGKRWWMTAAMTFLFPGHLVKDWQLRRVRRYVHSMDVHDAN